MKSKRMTLLAGLFGAVVAIGAATALTLDRGGFSAAGLTTSAQTVPVVGEMQTVKLTVHNMTCASCPFIVKRGLEDVAGVRNVDVSYRSKIATITFDDGQTNPDALMSATNRIGFPSQQIVGGI